MLPNLFTQTVEAGKAKVRHHQKKEEIQDLHKCRASQLQKLLVSLLKTLYCSMSGSLGTWKLTFIWIYQLSDHPGRVSLAHGDVGFLPAAGWWQEGMDCFSIPQKSCHIQWLASFKRKPYFFEGKLSLEGEYFSLHLVPAARLGLQFKVWIIFEVFTNLCQTQQGLIPFTTDWEAQINLFLRCMLYLVRKW